VAELEWYQEHDNLIALGTYLVDDLLFPARDLLYFFEKPWKYETEWIAFQNSKRTTEEVQA
jgi:hypothetical protein